MSVNVELCVSSVQEACKAAELGVNSIEVCTWLGCGGLTPSIGLITAIRAKMDLRIRVLIRPRPGDLQFDKDDRSVMLEDLRSIMGSGAAGSVIGALDAGRRMDREFMITIRARSIGHELTFHRAIDRSADPLQVLDDCMELKMDRILTSGAKPSAFEGIPMLSDMVRRTSGAVVIAAAGGIGPGNVVEVVEKTGVPEIHFSAQISIPRFLEGVPLSSDPTGDDRAVELDTRKVEGVLNSLVKAGLR